MEKEIITDNVGEKIEIGFDGEKFSLLHIRHLVGARTISVLNSEEARKIADFIIERLKKEVVA